MEIMSELMEFFGINNILAYYGSGDFPFSYLVLLLIMFYFATFIVMNVFRGIITMIGMVGREW